MPSMFCPKCGKPLTPESDRCPHCRIDLADWLSPDALDMLMGDDDINLSPEVTMIMQPTPTDPSQAEKNVTPTPAAEAAPADQAPAPDAAPAPAAVPVPATQAAPAAEAAATPVESADVTDNPDEPDSFVYTQNGTYGDVIGTVKAEEMSAGAEGQVISPLSVPRHSVQRPDEDLASDHRILIAIAALALTITVVFILTAGGCKPTFSDPQAEVVAERTAGNQAEGDEQTDEQTEEERAAQAKQASDDADYQHIQEYYSRLADYAQGAREAGAALEQNWLQPRATREPTSQAALELTNTIKGDLSSFNAQTVSNDSAWYDQAQEVRSCYEDLINYLTLVNNAWETDLSYPYPQQYKDQVFGELDANKSTETGEDKTLSSFQDTYDQIDLTR